MSTIQKGAAVKEIIEKLRQNKKKKAQVQTKQKEKTRHDGTAHVAEVYSLPRVAKMAKRLGMKADGHLIYEHRRVGRRAVGPQQAGNEGACTGSPFTGQAVYADSIANVHGILQI